LKKEQCFRYALAHIVTTCLLRNITQFLLGKIP
jgi:hypothetical protein